MSWTIEIVTSDIPYDDEDAWLLLEELREEDDQHEYGDPPSPELAELCRRLTARYPCITETDDPASPWADGPLINNFGDKMATLGIVTSRMEEALPFVIETATEMGFTVFDAGDETIHRPKGWKRPPQSPIPATPPSRPWWRSWS